MTVINFNEQQTVINQYLSKLRDKKYQQNRMLFRNNIIRIGEMMAFELSKTLEYKTKTVTTPLGSVDVRVPNERLVIATVLRAGLPFYQGYINVFDHAESAFVSAYRMYTNREHTEVGVHAEYMAAPSLKGKTLIIADPTDPQRQAQEDSCGMCHCNTRRHRGSEASFARGLHDMVCRHRPRHERTEIHRSWIRRLR